MMFHMRWRRGSGGGESPSDVGPLAVEDIADAVWSSLEARGLRWVVPEDDGGVRVTGPPGAFDPFLATELWFSPGVLRAECAVPVLVPEARVEPVLELCVRLSSQGRVAFALGPRYTPICCMTVRLLAGPPGVAADTVQASLGLLWERAAAAEALFFAVAAGADPREVVEWHLADDAGSLYGRYRAAGAESQELFDADIAALPGPQPESRLDDLPLPPAAPADSELVGTRWEWERDAPATWPDLEVPPGYTLLEYRGTFMALSRSVGVDGIGIIDACPGPVVIHADGVVECFGCTEPESVHVGGCTNACHEDLYLGRGHRCERCGELA